MQGRLLNFNQSDDLGRDTSLMNTRKELETLAKLQGGDMTVPDSQQPRVGLGDDSTTIPDSQQPSIVVQRHESTTIPDSQQPSIVQKHESTTITDSQQPKLLLEGL